MTPRRERYAALDTWRFIAAMGVVAYHFENHFSILAARPTAVLEGFGHFVDFFFVLSGFVLMHTYGTTIRSRADYALFMRKRLARVYPLHAATTLIFGTVAILAAHGFIHLRDPASLDPDLIVPHLLLVHAWGFGWQPGLNFPSWSISAELFVYLLFPLFALILLRAGALLTLLLAFVFAVAMEIVRLHLGMRSFVEATWDYGMLRAVPTFLAGMAIHAVVRAVPRVAMPWYVPHSFMAGIFVLMLADASLYVLLGAFVVAVALIAMAERTGVPTILHHRFAVRLGDASYAVYLLHTAFQVAALALARKLGLTSWPALAALGVATSLVIVAVSMACYTWFENPARRYFGRPRKQAAAAAPAPHAEGQRP